MRRRSLIEELIVALKIASACGADIDTSNELIPVNGWNENEPERLVFVPVHEIKAKLAELKDFISKT